MLEGGVVSVESVRVLRNAFTSRGASSETRLYAGNNQRRSPYCFQKLTIDSHTQSRALGTATNTTGHLMQRRLTSWTAQATYTSDQLSLRRASQPVRGHLISKPTSLEDSS